MSDFEDIVIVDLDLKKTTWSRVHSSMRTLYLKLSREPEVDWVRFFHEERESRIVPTRHGFWIEDGYIVFDCLLKNVETYHLPDFRLSVAYANARSHERREQQRDEIKQRHADNLAELAELDALRDLIRDGAPQIESAPTVASFAASVDAARTAVERHNAPSASDAAANDAYDFDARRHEWRTRFRHAMNSRKESDDESR